MKEPLWRLLGVCRGVTAVIGAGGKTTLLSTLANQLRGRGRVVLCTTTHIRRPPRIPCIEDRGQLPGALARWGLVCVGTPAEGGKLTAPPLPLGELARMADYVLVEADGARGLPMKAHAPHEPVIPPEAGRIILTVGAGGFGHPIREVCHRPALYAALAGVGESEPVTPAIASRVIRAEGLGEIVFLNQAETPGRLALAGELAAALELPVFGGSLWKEEVRCLS